MPIKKTIRITKELSDKINQHLIKQNISENQFYIKASEHYLSCNKAIKNIPTLKRIITRYKGKCSKCGSDIPIGSIAYWSKETLVCMDCFVLSMGDKALADRYIKMRQLNLVIRELQKRANELADDVNLHKYSLDLKHLFQKIEKLVELNEDYYKNFKEENMKEINDLYKKILREFEDLKIIIESKMKPIKYSV